MSRFRSDRGASAVEFAIIAIPLILLLAGIIDFGFAFSRQLALSSAAREGVRVMAVQNDAAAARSATLAAAPDAVVVISPADCTAGQTATVTASYPLESLTGVFDPLLSGKTLTGEGVMKCGG